MNIEVTNATFYMLFYSKHFTRTEKGELANKHYYSNSELEQGGLIIYNFTGQKNQYYLTDINS
tara:strand:+ start:2117 stop:2305 length:189 start_codon:yes stop_codon:yes gene_type:complete